MNVLTLFNKKTCDHDLTHSLDTLKHVFVKIVPEVVIRDNMIRAAHDTAYAQQPAFTASEKVQETFKIDRS